MNKIMTRDELTADQLRAILSYDSITGRFVRISSTRRDYRGSEAGGQRLLKSGLAYTRIKVGRFFYQAARLAWLYMTGAWPSGMVDHVNGNGIDNRWCNLRDATRQENARNSRRTRQHKIGLKGVYATCNKKFQSRIKYNGRVIYLGQFETKEEAHEAYCNSAAKLFGEFARAG